MTIAYLIDTDWVSHDLNGHAAMVERLEELQEQGLALSIIALAALNEGVYCSRDPEANERALNNFLRGVMVMGIDEDICRLFGRERGRLRAAGQLIGACALLLSATALHHLPLFTNHRRHFELIEGLPLMSLEVGSCKTLSDRVLYLSGIWIQSMLRGMLLSKQIWQGNNIILWNRFISNKGYGRYGVPS